MPPGPPPLGRDQPACQQRYRFALETTTASRRDQTAIPRRDGRLADHRPSSAHVDHPVQAATDRAPSTLGARDQQSLRIWQFAGVLHDASGACDRLYLFLGTAAVGGGARQHSRNQDPLEAV